MKVQGTDALTVSIGWLHLLAAAIVLGGTLFALWRSEQAAMDGLRGSVQTTNQKIETLTASIALSERAIAEMRAESKTVSQLVGALSERIGKLEQGLRFLEQRLVKVEARVGLAKGDDNGSSPPNSIGSETSPVSPTKKDDERSAPDPNTRLDLFKPKLELQ
jgi:hypothetical protein